MQSIVEDIRNNCINMENVLPMFLISDFWRVNSCTPATIVHDEFLVSFLINIDLVFEIIDWSE